MQFPVILAHGALGPFDELLLIGVVIAFVIIMAISWLRARNQPVDESTLPEEAINPNLLDDAERFKLD